jgi:hypothetical protein
MSLAGGQYTGPEKEYGKQGENTGAESSGTTGTDLDVTARSMDLLTVFILFSIFTSFAG